MFGIYLTPDLIGSEAFKSLSRWSLFVYFRFLQKRQFERKNISNKKKNERRILNNGEIIFTYREALKMGISERNFRNSIDELQAKGLIDIAKYGKGGRSGESTLYWIDIRWKHYNTEHFQPPKKPRIKDTIQGRGWTVYNAKKKLKAADKNDSAMSGENDRSLGKNSKKRLAKVTEVKKCKIVAIG